MNPKRQNQQSHKIAALCYLLAEALQEVEANAETALQMKSECESLGKKCENVLEDLFQVKQISASNYLQSLSNKIDTVIRKNFEEVLN